MNKNLKAVSVRSPCLYTGICSSTPPDTGTTLLSGLASSSICQRLLYISYNLQTSHLPPGYNEEGASQWGICAARWWGQREGHVEREWVAAQEDWEEAACFLDDFVPQELDIHQAPWESKLSALCLSCPAAKEWGVRRRASVCVWPQYVYVWEPVSNRVFKEASQTWSQVNLCVCVCVTFKWMKAATSVGTPLFSKAPLRLYWRWSNRWRTRTPSFLCWEMNPSGLSRSLHSSPIWPTVWADDMKGGFIQSGTFQADTGWQWSDMVVTHLALELRFQGKKLRGFSCKLTRSANGFLPENSWIITLQVLLPYLLSGLGMVAAGIVMDKVQVCKKICYYMPVFKLLWVYYV